MMVYGESEYIYGIHASSGGDGWGSTGADLLNGKGWVCFTEAIGRDPLDMSGRSYIPWAEKDLGIIVRLNHGYRPHGTIPKSVYYGDFATRCGNYVHSSQGCHIWIIGNEPNHSQERPQGEIITPYDYARCYDLCRDEIHRAQAGTVVLMAGPAPWNWESGDFGRYWEMCLSEVSGCPDGVSIHTYTHGPDPGSVSDNTKMQPPGENYFWNFRVYQDLLQSVPADIPIYITETDQETPWMDVDYGWIKEAYREIDQWNRDAPGRRIRSLCLYRWDHDRWEFKTKAAVQSDLLQAIGEGYKWTEEPTMPTMWKVVHFDGLEAPFQEQAGMPKVVPAGHTILYNKALARPEMDAKIVRQQEVYPDGGRQSAVGFLPYKTFQWWSHTTGPIAIGAGLRTRASAMVMIVANGIDGDPNRPGACGMRVGISSASIADPLSLEIIWSDWWVVRDTLENERVWTKAQTPEYIPTVGQVRLWVQCNADVAAAISAGHWDAELIEQVTENGGPIPPPTNCRGATPEEVRQIVREELSRLQLTMT